MHKRFILPAVVASSVAVSGIAVAPAAHAAAQCSLTAPSQVHVWHYYTKVDLRASGACTRGDGWGAWYAYHPTRGLQDVASFDGSTKDISDFYDWGPFGTYTWRPGGAYDSNFNKLSQNTVKTTFRLGSKVTMSTSRSRGRVSLKVSATRWSPTAERTVKYSGTNGSIQYRTSSKAAWKTLKTFRTSKTGAYSLTYTSSKSRYYRTVLKGSSVVWSATSGTYKR